MPSAQNRLGGLDTLMAQDTFWNNRDQAQKLIDEASSLRKKIDPLVQAEKRLEDLGVMIELCEAEPEETHDKHRLELEQDLA